LKTDYPHLLKQRGAGLEVGVDRQEPFRENETVTKGTKKDEVKCTPSQAAAVLGKLSYPARVKKFGEKAVLSTACENLKLARDKRWAT
jgi:hypothetical protein